MKQMVDIPHEDRAGYTCIAGGLICDKCKAETYKYTPTTDIKELRKFDASDSPLYEKFGYQNYVTPTVGKYADIDLCPRCLKKTTALEMIEISKKRQAELKKEIQKIFVDWKPPSNLTCTVTVTCPTSTPCLPLKDENWVPSYPNEKPETILPLECDPLHVKLFEDASEPQYPSSWIGS